MNEKRASLEIIAPSIEEAIAQGLDELGLPEEAVNVARVCWEWASVRHVSG
jgi:hypothetical protein